jgi:hypothetical protein
MKNKYPGAFEIIFEKKFWPHIDKTGGFFVAKIRKIASIKKEIEASEWKTPETKKHQNSNNELRLYRGNISPWSLQEGITLYEHE